MWSRCSADWSRLALSRWAAAARPRAGITSSRNGSEDRHPCRPPQAVVAWRPASTCARRRRHGPPQADRVILFEGRHTTFFRVGKRLVQAYRQPTRSSHRRGLTGDSASAQSSRSQKPSDSWLSRPVGLDTDKSPISAHSAPLAQSSGIIADGADQTGIKKVVTLV